MNNKIILQLGNRILGIAKLTVFLYPDFQIKYWIENCPNIWPNGIHLSFGWITVSWRI